MIQFDAKWPEVEALIKLALAELKNDEVLFRIHANERSITHRLALCLEKPFTDWNVDCEYSRIGEDPNNYKRLLLPTAESVTHFDMDGSRVYPDIVIHHRGQNTLKDNLLVIEVKTEWSRVSDEQDLRKLLAFTGQYPVEQFVIYRYGLFLKFDERGEVSMSRPFEAKV
jgi:hypothetical protein